MGSPVPKALTKLQCHGAVRTLVCCWAVALFGGAHLNQWQKKAHPAAVGNIRRGVGLASGSIQQRRAFVCADIWYAGYRCQIWLYIPGFNNSGCCWEPCSRALQMSPP